MHHVILYSSFVWTLITDDGSIQEMGIWSILIIESNFNTMYQPEWKSLGFYYSGRLGDGSLNKVNISTYPFDVGCDSS